MRKISTSSAVVAPSVDSVDNGDKVAPGQVPAGGTGGLLPGQRWSVGRHIMCNDGIHAELDCRSSIKNGVERALRRSVSTGARHAITRHAGKL